MRLTGYRYISNFAGTTLQACGSTSPMPMIRTTIFLLSLLSAFHIDAQSVLSRVIFPIDDHQTRAVLAKAGIDLSHGSSQDRNSFTTEIEDYQLTRLDQMGIRYTIEIPDLSQHRKQNHLHGQRENFLECQDHTFDAVVPKNFELGNVGGFFSMPEILDHLDAMAILYPHLISIRRPIGNFKTYQNNSIFWVRISDQPETDENEPEILYTGLHHAREFITVSQTIYYMWYLLENYDKDPVIKQILDHTELYFVPVVNPDGLNYNVAGYVESEDVFTRNLRKNLRDNDGDGTFEIEVDGVDLNRNYGHEWAYDDEGSSGFGGSDTYRGPAPFSEPETQAVEYFCNTHDFKLALNYHSYGDVLVYPWGYNDSNTPDSILYSNYGHLLTKLNRFIYGTGTETVGYVTNGDSDDWMYGEQEIYSFTPEVGDPDDGFYPLRDRIIPLCQSTLNLNLTAARLVNSLVDITDESPRFIHSGINPLELGFNRYGLLNGEVVISFSGLSPHLIQLPSPINLNLDQFEPHERDLTFTLNNQVPYGSTIQIEVICQQGQYIFRDTLTKVRADFSTILTQDEDLSQWDVTGGQNWGSTNETFKSGPVCIADSPNGTYNADAHEVIMLKQEVDLHQVSSAYAQFWAKWEIEDHYDYVVFQASTDGENWENLCGEQSKLGSLFQLYEEPLYDGKQAHWVLENTDLSSFVDQTIQLRFLLVSDGFIHYDGFYFDDFKVITIDEETVSTNPLDASTFSVRPNPAGSFFTIEIPEMPQPSIRVFNSLGRLTYVESAVESRSHDIITESWPSGLYHYQILSGGVPQFSGTISLVK